MFGRDPVLPLNTLLEPKLQYLGNDINILSLEAMKNMYEIAATNLKIAREEAMKITNLKIEKEIPPKTLNLYLYSLVTQCWYKITLKDHLIQSILVIIVLYQSKEIKLKSDPLLEDLQK